MYSPSSPLVTDPESYDAIVIGSGLAGLSSAVYLTDAGKRILILEKESSLGGLASWTDANGGEIMFDRGAAYWTDSYEEEQAILDHIGLKNYRDLYPIPEPIDSYYVRGGYFAGIWDEDTVKKLPASFELFHFELQMADATNQIPNQPFEDFALYGGKMDLDRLNTKQWIESMPSLLKARMKKLKDAAATTLDSGEKNVEKNPVFAWSEAQRIWARFRAERKAGKLAGPTGMQGVVELMDLYCRSALGNTTAYVNAMAFANFYISEIVTRYTTPKGTGIAAYNMVQLLNARTELLTVKTDSPVTRIVSADDHVDVYYVKDGIRHLVRGQYAVFSSALKLAPALIDGFNEKAPEQGRLIAKLNYADYLVHNIYLKGHPYRSAYDTWMYPTNYSDDHPTDFILGRWMDPKMLGYNGYRDFKTDPPDDLGVLTVYHPLTPAWRKTNAVYDDAKVIDAAHAASDYVIGLIEKLPPDRYRGPVDVTKIETSRWPLSVHIAPPGYYSKDCPGSSASIRSRLFRQ